jgi:exonuclease III
MKPLLPTVIGFLIAAVASHAANGQTIRVATFNVNYGNRSGDQVLDAIEKSRADILCLQETTLQSERFLQQQLAVDYPEFHAIGHQGTYYGERFVFASKQKPRNLKFVPPTHGLFGFYSATFSFDDKDVCIINVHLTPFGVPPNAGVVQALAAVGATEKQHAAEIREILKAVPSDSPVVVLGDFNSLSTFRAPTALINAGFTDSFASLHKNPDTHHTWQWPTRPLPLKLRIDYIFHSNHFRSLQSEIIRRDGSDHFLLVSEIKFHKPAAAINLPADSQVGTAGTAQTAEAQ